MKKLLVQKKVFICQTYTGIASLTSIVISSQAFASNWGFCDSNKLAWADANFTVRKVEADAICSLPTAPETGDATYLNTTRCLNSQTDSCSAAALVPAGQVPSGFGSNDVPQNAWYAAAGATPTYSHIRCSCGCFTPDTNILTATGWQRIDILKDNASMAKDRVLIPTSEQGLTFKPSPYLKPIAFTKGTEDKPVIRVQTSKNLAVELTELHPVPIKHGKKIKMVQAKTLIIGDIIFDTNGKPQEIVKISTRMLDKTSNSVYNLNTFGHGDTEHIVVANGIRVGDLGWQNKLAERTQRSDNILKYN